MPDQQQRLFIRKIRDEIISLEDLIKQCGVSGEQLSRWLRGKRFRRSVAGALRGMRRRLTLELELGRMIGARRLTGLVGSRDYHTARLASLNLLGLNRITRQPHKRPRAATAQGTKTEPTPAPIHPHVSAEEADRLLDVLEGKAT